ncbi:MAG TPA: ATP-binding protein [Bacteriovoracaceae bacterium]|nr:ATP-binding protein [Bacteriovoracaceae bacterium]
MEKVPFSKNEAERLQELLEYQIIDTPPDPRFDVLAQIAAYICETPISFVSLIDCKRQWFKARVGMKEEELPRELSFCNYTINQMEAFVINDAENDLRFADNPYVTGPPYLKFYAGVPLISSRGFALGTLAVIDFLPRYISPDKIRMLQMISRQVVSLIELRKALGDNNEKFFKIQGLSKSVLQQKIKLHHLEQMELMSGMAAGMCHEINNPLSVIMLVAESMKKYFLHQRPQQTSEIQKMDKLIRSGIRIEHIVKGLKLFATHRDLPFKEHLLLSEIISETLMMCDERLKQNGVKLIKEIPGHIQFKGDRAQIIQVLSNLISNSVDAIKDCKEKWIEIHVESSAIESFFRLRIIDSGFGINDEVVKKMMRPFFSTKDIGKGAGLGLSICRGIIKDHGGDLFYEVSNNHTSFVLELPLFEPNLH